jgi:hypothetical protein
MISSEVQRTLVKSPPELWSELSDPIALARHLGELGEIRIVRVVPEKTVEWAAEHTTGTVSIQPSGWGTKVTLSVTRELVVPTPSPAEQESAEPIAEIEPTSEEPRQESAEDLPEPAADLPELAAAETPESSATTAVPEAEGEPPRVGFFARLFGRRRWRERAADPQNETIAPTPEPEPEPGDAFAAVSEALAQESADSHAFADPHELVAPAGAPEQTEQTEPSEPEEDVQPEQSTDIAAELMAAEEVAAEEVAAEEVTAVLAAVLDRLGAAHHRPFSRS